MLQTTFAPAKEFRQFFHGTVGFGNFEIRGFNARYFGQYFFHPLTGPSSGDEGDVVLAQVLNDQSARKSVGTIDHHWGLFVMVACTPRELEGAILYAWARF